MNRGYGKNKYSFYRNTYNPENIDSETVAIAEQLDFSSSNSDPLLDSEGGGSPYWLQNVVGSLAEERRNSKPRNFNAYNNGVKRARKLVQGLNTLEALFSNPDEFCIKLSDLEALYPSTTFGFSINIQELIKSNMKLLRSFLVYFYSRKESLKPWVAELVEIELDKILKMEKVYQNSKVYKENLIIRQTFLILGNIAGQELLNQVYSEDNLNRWKKTGKSLTAHLLVIKIPFAKVKTKVWRRGYKETSSNNNKTKSQEGRVKMSRESQELERIKDRIRLKQAKLFEERLDRYLQIQDPDLPKSVKRDLFNSLLEVDLTEEEEENKNLKSTFNQEE